LFTGPTGTGKTELAKCIAEYLYGGSERLVRFDMGELNTSDAPSRLVGDRAEPEGQLTRAVRAQPFSVLLFDEIEKAHPAVLNLMLQIFDDGRLTDARGSVADFSHTVIVLTSNLGAGKRTVRGFVEDPKTVTADVARAVREFFPPELFNRIDRVVPFQPLGRAEAKDITKKELARLAARPGLSERNVFVRFTDAVVDEIVDQGYSAEYGARALKRYIDRAIGDLLTNALTSERRAEMRLLWLYHHENKLSVHAEALREAEPVSTTSFVETLLSENPSELRKRIPRALDALRALEHDGRLETLGNDLTRALEGYRLGDGERADLVFHLDTLRTHITHLTRRLESRISADTELQEIERRRKRQSGQELAGDDFTTLADAFGHERGHPNRGTRPPRRLSVRVLRKDKHLLADLAEVAFLRQMVDHAGAADRHVAVIDLVRLAAHHERRRFSGGTPGLLEWLSRAYASARGKLEASAVALGDGTIRSASSLEGLDELLESRPRQVVLRVIGPGVTDFLAGETGCHVRRSAGTGPEIVRVRVYPGSRDLKAHLDEHSVARSAFEGALESARGLPENPEALLPVVRSIRFDPIPGRAAPASIEDYRFAHIATRRVRDLGELLSDFWLLAAGRSVKDVFE
jgi:ATP-dependent Clp protease ATP-binding subunit ClpA/ATP-dependent Clp protease ATP-binding subunit ClpC